MKFRTQSQDKSDKAPGISIAWTKAIGLLQRILPWRNGANTDANDTGIIGDEEYSRAFRPILFGFTLPAAIYYAIVVFLHYNDEPFGNFLILGGIAAITSVVGFVLSHQLRTRSAGRVRLEIYALTIFGLAYANILAYQLIHLETAKLIYFVLLTMAVATAGVSLRVILPVTAISLVTAIALAGQAGPEAQDQFAYIALATTFIAIGMAFLMRRAIDREIRARMALQVMHNEAMNAADTDFLTKLPNRRSFTRHLDSKFRENDDIALGLVDLNGFKQVNDLFGHVFGDALLADVAQRIRKACGNEVFVARLGGDEFALVLENATGRAEMAALGREICSAINQSYGVSGNQVSLSAAVGFSRRYAATATTHQLYEQADFALYRGKASRSGAVEIFSGKLVSELNRVKTIEQQLLISAFETEMHMEYQPLVDSIDNTIIGFEALARWRNPELGNVRADDFIRAAERCGVMDRLTPILLKASLADAVAWPDTIRLSFNLSARDLVSVETIDTICRIVGESGFPADRIDFEVTETAIMADFERARDSITRLRALGSDIALDDFGTGYANFQHIGEIHADKLKIDRAFIAKLGTPENSGIVVSTMIDMCRKMDIDCIAEGVEEQSELDALQEIGGRLVQGYLFGRPMPSSDIAAFLARFPTSETTAIRASA